MNFNPNPKIFIAAFLMLSAGACEQKEKTVPKKNPVYSVGIESKIARIISNLQQEVDEGVFESKSLAERMVQTHSPGVSIAVINKGEIEWARGFGLADDRTRDSVGVETLFQAGSVSKPTFALGVMKLKEKGVLDLDKDVNEYLTSWKVPAVEGWQPTVTLRQLLSHTAGLTVHGFPGYLASEPIPTVPQILKGESPSNTPEVRVNILPGMNFRYSGGGTTVAQLVVTDVVKKPFPDFMREEIFKPLKLKHSTYQQPLPDSLTGLASTAFPNKAQPVKGRFHVYPEMAAAGLWTNPTELATLLIEVQRGAMGESRLFKKITIDEMLTPQKVEGRKIGIGFFLEEAGDSLRFGHSGWDEGFVTMAVAYKELGMGAVIMINSNEGNDMLEEIMDAIAIEYKWPAWGEKPRKQVPVSVAEMKSMVGTYESEGRQLRIEGYEGQIISLIYNDLPPLLLVKMADGTFRNRRMNFTITFEKDALKFSQAGRTTLYKRVQGKARRSR